MSNIYFFFSVFFRKLDFNFVFFLFHYEGNNEAHPLPCSVRRGWFFCWWSPGFGALSVVCVSILYIPLDSIIVIRWSPVPAISVTLNRFIRFFSYQRSTTAISVGKAFTPFFHRQTRPSKLQFNPFTFFFFLQLPLSVTRTWQPLRWDSSWSLTTTPRHPRATAVNPLPELHPSLNSQGCRRMYATPCSSAEAPLALFRQCDQNFWRPSYCVNSLLWLSGMAFIDALDVSEPSLNLWTNFCCVLD